MYNIQIPFRSLIFFFYLLKNFVICGEFRRLVFFLFVFILSPVIVSARNRYNAIEIYAITNLNTLLNINILDLEKHATRYRVTNRERR